MSIPSKSRMTAEKKYLGKDNMGGPEKVATVPNMKIKSHF